MDSFTEMFLSCLCGNQLSSKSRLDTSVANSEELWHSRLTKGCFLQQHGAQRYFRAMRLWLDIDAPKSDLVWHVSVCVLSGEDLCAMVG